MIKKLILIHHLSFELLIFFIKKLERLLVSPLLHIIRLIKTKTKTKTKIKLRLIIQKFLFLFKKKKLK
jgi:hypothetical protein